jgi:hypothetical protein
MRYMIVKDASLRKSMARYRNLGDDRWRLFDALLTSSTRTEYLNKVHGFVQERVSRQTGKTWLVTAENYFDYVLRNGRIAKDQK